MALYDQLPVYKDSYDLLLLLFRVCKHMDRDYRFTLGETAKKELADVIVDVYRANGREHKAPHVEAAREKTERIRVLLRIANDLKQVRLEDFIAMSEKLESISRQLAGWQKAESVKKPKNTQHLQGQSSDGLFAFQERTG